MHTTSELFRYYTHAAPGLHKITTKHIAALPETNRMPLLAEPLSLQCKGRQKKTYILHSHFSFDHLWFSSGTI